MVMKSKNYGHSFDEVYGAAIKAIGILDFDIESENEDSGIIRATIDRSLYSWGEIINIAISVKDHGCNVKVESKATRQVFSWGKTEKNVLKFFEALESYL